MKKRLPKTTESATSDVVDKGCDTLSEKKMRGWGIQPEAAILNSILVIEW